MSFDRRSTAPASSLAGAEAPRRCRTWARPPQRLREPQLLLSSGTASLGRPQLGIPSQAQLPLRWLGIRYRLPSAFPVPPQPLPQKGTVLLIPFCKVSKGTKTQFLLLSSEIYRCESRSNHLPFLLVTLRASGYLPAFKCTAPPDTSYV